METIFKLHPMDVSTPPFNVRLHLLFESTSCEASLVRDALLQALSEPVCRAFPAAFGRLGQDRLHVLLDSPEERNFEFQFSHAPDLDSSTIQKPDNSYRYGALPVGLAPNLHLYGVRLTVLGDSSLYLAFAINHFVADFAAFQRLVQYTCASTSRILNDCPNIEVPAPPSHTLNRDYYSLFGSHNESRPLPPLLGYKHGVTLSPFSRPETAPPVARQISLTLSLASLAELKRAASPKEGGGAWISTADAVTALLWRSTSRAKAVCQGSAPTDMVKIAMAVELRGSIAADDVHDQFWGNCVREGILSLPLASLCESAKLAETALYIRKCLSEARASDSVIAMLRWFDDAVEHHSRVPALDLDPVYGLDHVTSNWSRYDLLKPGLFDLGMHGGSSREAPKALDTGGFPLPRGVSVIMRAGGEGVLKAQLGLSRDEAFALANDAELSRFAHVTVESN